MRVCVIGAGIVGAATAYAIARGGHRVTVLERASNVGLGTSFANGAQLSYSYVAPLAEPAVLWTLPGWLLRRDSPLRFILASDHRQWMWCLEFLCRCQAGLAQTATRQLLQLGSRSRLLVASLVREEGIKFDHRSNGKLVLYRRRAGFEAAKRQVDRNLSSGQPQEILDVRSCIALEPALEQNLASHLCGGIFTPSDEVGDCYKLVAELARVASERYGADFRFNQRVVSLKVHRSRVAAAITDRAVFEAEAFVVCAGLQSRVLLNSLGVRLPLWPLSGYSLTVPIDSIHRPPRINITDADRKVVYATIGDRFRVAGMVDIQGFVTQPDAQRAASLMHEARQVFPDGGDFSRAVNWFGDRPATPSGKPIIGQVAHENLWINVGHGALGFTLALGCAQLLSAKLARAPMNSEEMSGFSPRC